jgi:hypothetical protein
MLSAKASGQTNTQTASLRQAHFIYGRRQLLGAASSLTPITIATIFRETDTT